MELWRAKLCSALTLVQERLIYPGKFADATIGKLCPGVRFQRDGTTSWMEPATATFLSARCAEIGVELDYETLPWPYAIDEQAVVTDDYAKALPYIRPAAIEALRDTHGCLRPWQRAAPQRAIQLGRQSAWHTPGAGKTLEGIVWLLAAYAASQQRTFLPGALGRAGAGRVPLTRRWMGGPASRLPVALLYVTTVAATFQAADDFKRFTTLEPYVHVAPSHRRKKTPLIADYLKRTRAAGVPAVIIVGREHLATLMFYPAAEGESISDAADLLPALTGHAIPAVVIDEIHEYRSHKLWEYDPESETCALRDNQAAALNLLVNGVGHRLLSSALTVEWNHFIPWRFGLSGTPTGGPVAELYAQLELIDPGMWGTWYEFATRWAGGGPFGYNNSFIAKSATHTQELRHRLAPWKHSVTRKDAAPYMPKFDLQVVRIPVEAQAKGTPPFKKALKALRAGTDEEATACLLTQVAASKKLPWVVDTVVAELREGRKALCFTGFVADVERIREQVARRCAEARVFATHGELHTAEQRNVMARDYNAHEGAALFVGTGDVLGQSLNLQNTDVVVFAQIPFTVIKITQWMGRALRLGQVRARAIRFVFPIAMGTYDSDRLKDIIKLKAGNVSEVTGEDSALALAISMETPAEEKKAALDAFVAAMLGEDTGDLVFDESD